MHPLEDDENDEIKKSEKIAFDEQLRSDFKITITKAKSLLNTYIYKFSNDWFIKKACILILVFVFQKMGNVELFG